MVVDSLISISFYNIYERRRPKLLHFKKRRWIRTTFILIMKVVGRDGDQICFTGGCEHRRELPLEVHISTSAQRTTTMFLHIMRAMRGAWFVYLFFKKQSSVTSTMSYYDIRIGTIRFSLSESCICMHEMISLYYFTRTAWHEYEYTTGKVFQCY